MTISLLRSAPRALLAALAALAMHCGSPAPGPDAATRDAPAGNDASGDGATNDGSGPRARANGTLGEWQTLAAMPLPRANHCSVVTNGFLVVIGGNYRPAGATDFVNIDNVDVARLGADGSLGAWATAGHTPSAVNSCTAAASADGRIFLVDGLYTDATNAAQVWTAALAPDGTLGAWSSLGPLPTDLRVLASFAFTRSGALYALSGRLPGSGDAGVGDALVALHAPLAATGPLAWSVDTFHAGWRGRPQLAASDAYVFSLGGYLGGDMMNQVVTDAFVAPIGADGAVGTASDTTALPAPTTFGQAVVVDEYVFVLGGRPVALGGGAVATVSSAQIGGDGRLGAWSAQAAMPAARTNHAAVLGGDFVYVTGGGRDGPGLDTVFAARARF